MPSCVHQWIRIAAQSSRFSVSYRVVLTKYSVFATGCARLLGSQRKTEEYFDFSCLLGLGFRNMLSASLRVRAPLKLAMTSYSIKAC